MDVRIKRIDPTLPLPRYATAGAVAFDLCARTTVTIAPRQTARVPCNVVIEVPPGYALIVASRSSTPVRKGLLKANGVGIIDQDYCGDTDEIQALFHNVTARRCDRGARRTDRPGAPHSGAARYVGRGGALWQRRPRWLWQHRRLTPQHCAGAYSVTFSDRIAKPMSGNSVYGSGRCSICAV